MAEFEPKKKEEKERLSVTIDKSLMNMIKEIMVGYNVNISTATNDVLEYFKDEAWDKGKVEKTLVKDNKKKEIIKT